MMGESDDPPEAECERCDIPADYRGTTETRGGIVHDFACPECKYGGAITIRDGLVQTVGSVRWVRLAADGDGNLVETAIHKAKHGSAIGSASEIEEAAAMLRERAAHVREGWT